MGRREGEVANCSNGVAGNFGALAGFASSETSASVLLNGWPHEALGYEISRCLIRLVAEEMQRVEDLTYGEEMGRIDEIYLNKCRSNARLRCRGLGVFRAVVLWYSPAASVVNHSPGLRKCTSCVTGAVITSNRESASATTLS